MWGRKARGCPEGYRRYLWWDVILDTDDEDRECLVLWLYYGRLADPEPKAGA